MAQAEQASDERAQLTDRERDAFQAIFDLLIPDGFRILRYDKRWMITRLLQVVEEDIAVVRLQMRKVLKSLKACYEEEEEEVP